MNAALSRRVGQVMTLPAIASLPAANRERLVRAVSRADNFESLSKEHRDVIVEAEGQLASVLGGV